LELKKTTKDPNEYTGMTYIITVYFDDTTSKEYVHFGNMFLKESGKDWYEIPYNKAQELERIYNSLEYIASK
jgi:hypothetical protein